MQKPLGPYTPIVRAGDWLIVSGQVGAKDGQLKQWTVTDPQGYDTTVAVYNLDTSRKVDPGLFKIDFTNYSTPPG